jgi:NMD protein affecting ribosome stability and mRNA decay
MIALRVCANCGKLLGLKGIAKIAGMKFRKTHGMCPACLKKAYKELAKMTLDGRATLVTGARP